MAISKIGPLALTNGGGSVATNTASGTNALNSNTSGASNSAFGYGALQTNTTANYNTAVGYQAGYLNTTGSPNTYIGYRAGWTGSTNNACTAVGHQALYSNTGNGNTAVGGSDNVTYGGPLQSNTTGVVNSAFGAGTMGANTTGSYNTGLGMQALASNTTANYNTAVGYQAGYNSTTPENTFLGYQAGLSGSTSGTGGNTVIGYATGGSLTSGARNTLIGYGAGTFLTTGSRNTFVGNRSGSADGAGFSITTGSANTIIGGYGGNQGGLDIRTASNYIVLSDGDGNPRVVDNGTGTYLSGAIGTSFPTFSSKLYIADPSTVNCGVYMVTNNSGAQTRIFFGNPNGIVGQIYTNGSGTTFSTSSDYRLKENVVPMTGALATVAQLNPVTYNWKADGSSGQGFIAHELQQVFPEAVTGTKDQVNEDGTINPQGIDTSFLVATLTAAIQELKAEFDEYKRTHP